MWPWTTNAVWFVSDAPICFGFLWRNWFICLFHFYPIIAIFLFLFPMCWWFREQEFVIPSEGATFMALETWYQYVFGPGTYAWADVGGTFWQMHCFAFYNQTTIPFCSELCYPGLSVLPPSLGQVAHSQHETKQSFTWEWGSPILK